MHRAMNTSDIQPAMKASLSRLKLGFRTLILVLGFLQAWAGRFYIEHDGVNYLDVAEAYARRDWLHAINGYWSPLYSWLLAIIEIIFRPAPYWESTYLHLLNFFLFVLALIAFEFFLSRLLALVNSLFPELNDESVHVPPGRGGFSATRRSPFARCESSLLETTRPIWDWPRLVFLATGILIDLRQSHAACCATRCSELFLVSRT